MAIFQSSDPRKLALERQLAESQQPLAIDAGITERRNTLAIASRPVPDDPRLVQLESDVKFSATQLENTRLTIAQDLSWALINSPSFLFNR